MNYPPNFYPPTKTERLQSALIALDKLHAEGDTTDDEYVQLVDLLKPMIQRARLCDKLDRIVHQLNSEEEFHIDLYDELLILREKHEPMDDVAMKDLRLVTRRLERVKY